MEAWFVASMGVAGISLLISEIIALLAHQLMDTALPVLLEEKGSVQHSPPYTQ